MSAHELKAASLSACGHCLDSLYLPFAIVQAATAAEATKPCDGGTRPAATRQQNSKLKLNHRQQHEIV